MGVKSSIILIEVSRIDYTHTHTQLLPENLCVLDLFAAQNSIYVLQLDLVLHSAKNLMDWREQFPENPTRE